MKRHLLLVCLFLLPTPPAGAVPKDAPPAATATVAGLPVTVRGSSVTVDAENNNDLTQVNLEKDALTPFIALLKAYPRARRIELSWYAPIFLDATGVDMLYDRRAHTVTVEYSDGGGEDPQYGGTMRFTHVRESVFAAILKAHPQGTPENDPVSDKIADAHGNNASDWGGFQFLYQPRYGCRFRVVKARHKIALLPASSFPASS